MSPKLLFAVAVITGLLYSCSSNPAKPGIKTKYSINRDKINDTASKLDTLYISGGLTTTYAYDDTGGLISQISSDGNKTIIVRTGNVVISTQTDSSGKVISKETEILNEKGQADSSIIEQNGRITSTHKNVYNAQGLEIETRQYTLGGMQNQLRRDFTWKLNYKDSNIVAEILHFAVMTDTIAMLNPKTLQMDTIIQRMETPEVTMYYDYFADKLNINHGFNNSKNLPKRSVTLSGPNDTTQVNNYRYAFDDKGRVISEVMESIPGYKDGTSIQLEYDSIGYTYY